MAGRKSKLTKEVQNTICQALKAGNTRRASALYAGISETTFYDWLKKGEEKKRGLFPEFLEAVTRAENECEIFHVAILKKHAEKDWRASIAWLERRRVDDWGKKEKIEHSGSIGTEIKFIDFADD